MLQSIPLQIATRPKKVAGDISAQFGLSAGFRQQGSMNQFDAEPFPIGRLPNATSRQLPVVITARNFACLTSWDR
jgi:hypothetical protein